MHKVADLGANYRTQHYLGRATVEPSAALLELAMPRLDELALERAADQQLASVLDALQYLRRVWLQDAPILIQNAGPAYITHFPQLPQIMAHPDWPKFEAMVLSKHKASLRAVLESRAPPRPQQHVAACAAPPPLLAQGRAELAAQIASIQSQAGTAAHAARAAADHATARSLARRHARRAPQQAAAHRASQCCPRHTDSLASARGTGSTCCSRARGASRANQRDMQVQAS